MKRVLRQPSSLNEGGFFVITRRNFLASAGAALIYAPPIVRAGSLMPLRGIVVPKALHFGFVDRLLVHTHLPHITRAQNEGFSLQEVASELNRRGPKPWLNGEVW